MASSPSGDDGFVEEHGGLDEAAAAIAGLLLPPSAACASTFLDVPVPLACRRFSSDGGRTRRNDDIRFGMTRRYGVVDWLSVISAISDHGGKGTRKTHVVGLVETVPDALRCPRAVDPRQDAA